MASRRIAIPETVRAQLWVAAGGRCEFTGCNQRLDQNTITKQKLFVGEHAHIIADSPQGPRGNEESKSLAHEASNLMLLCRECHKTIDARAESYPTELLRKMKKTHEERIQRLYDIDQTSTSVAVVLRHPIKQAHVPHFTDQDVANAILKNSSFRHGPGAVIDLDFRQNQSQDTDPEYWSQVTRQMRERFERQFHLVSDKAPPTHLSVLGFAPMHMNMQLGVLLGNKTAAATFQWDRTRETWDFPAQRQAKPQQVQMPEVPPASGDRQLAIALAFSAEVALDAVHEAVPGVPVVRFGVPRPTPMLVEDADDIRQFRSDITALMARVRNAGYTRVHLFPAMPLSLAVELGRQVLPKADPPIDVWDYFNPRFARVHALQYP